MSKQEPEVVVHGTVGDAQYVGVQFGPPPGETWHGIPINSSPPPALASGMTLRDWFAGQAIIGQLNVMGRGEWGAVPEAAYELADMMLAQREKKAGG